MGNEEPGRESETIEVQEGNAGEAQEIDPDARRPRGDETVSEEELEEWQRELRTERRWAGPELEEEPRTRGGDEDVPDVEPTETEDAPEDAAS
jgi:hypothetical protein